MNIRNMIAKTWSVCVCAAALTIAPTLMGPLLSDVLEKPFQLGVVNAQLPECQNKPKRKNRRLPAIGAKLFKKMEPASAAVSPEPDPKTGVAPKPRYKEGLAMLKKLIARCDGCNKYELAQLYNLAAFASYSLNKTGDAIKYYQKVLEQAPMIAFQQEQQSLYTVAQLLMTEERFKESLATFRKWEKTCPKTINADYYFMLGQLFYQMNDKSKALKNVNRSVKMVEAKQTNNIPKEGWYRLQMALYVEKEDYKMAVKIMEKVVTSYPKKKNWSQLAGLYGLVEREKDQQGALDALNVMGMLDKKADARNLAYIYLGNEVPYLSAKIFKSAMKRKIIDRSAKNLEVYASALRQAHEIDDAIVVMEEAAKKSETGQIYVNLSAIYLDGDKFQKAITAGKKALDKKGLKSQGEVHMYIGQALMNLEKYGSAIQSFRKAAEDERFKRYVPALISYAEREKRRAEQLRKSQREVSDA